MDAASPGSAAQDSEVWLRVAPRELLAVLLHLRMRKYLPIFVLHVWAKKSGTFEANLREMALRRELLALAWVGQEGKSKKDALSEWVAMMQKFEEAYPPWPDVQTRNSLGSWSASQHRASNVGIAPACWARKKNPSSPRGWLTLSAEYSELDKSEVPSRDLSSKELSARNKPGDPGSGRLLAAISTAATGV